MKVRVEADGTPSGTRIITGDGDTSLTKKVSGIVFRHEGGGIPRIELEMGLVPMTVEGRAVMMGPGGREIRRIEYADGTADEFD